MNAPEEGKMGSVFLFADKQYCIHFHHAPDVPLIRKTMKKLKQIDIKWKKRGICEKNCKKCCCNNDSECELCEWLENEKKDLFILPELSAKQLETLQEKGWDKDVYTLCAGPHEGPLISNKGEQCVATDLIVWGCRKCTNYVYVRSNPKLLETVKDAETWWHLATTYFAMKQKIDFKRNKMSSNPEPDEGLLEAVSGWSPLDRTHKKCGIVKPCQRVQVPKCAM